MLPKGSCPVPVFGVCLLGGMEVLEIPVKGEEDI
jgi:hypothetical protein